MPYQLGITLHNLRKRKGISLRRVERDTGISNAYLSQLERSIAKRPAPEKLQVLADYFAIPYVKLLKYAGYLQSQSDDEAINLMSNLERPDENKSAVVSSIADLTEDEENLVLLYIEFLKGRRKQSS